MGLGFRLEHCRKRMAATLADDNYDLTLAGSDGELSDGRYDFLSDCRLDVAAEISAVHLG